MKRLYIVCLALLLAACQAIVKVEGEQLIGGRLSLSLPSAWNQMPNPRAQPYQTWTQEGLTIDQLRLWVGIQEGGLLALAAPMRTGDQQAAKAPVFSNRMSEEELAHLFEVAYAGDGSVVKMTKLEPTQFAGAKGLRMEFTVTGQQDHVVRNGIVWLSIQKNELHAMGFTAPRLGFFQRQRAGVEAMAAGARIKP